MEEQRTGDFMPLHRRLVKVFFSPGEVFDSLRERPAWFWALVAGAVLVILSVLLVPSEIWVQVMREQAAEEGRDLPPFLASAGTAFRLISVVSGVVFWFLWAFVFSGVATFFFAFLLGDQGRYSQYLSVISHALFIGAVGSLVVVPLKILQQDPSLTLSLGTFFTFLGEGYPLRVLNGLDLFNLWSAAVMAVGATRVDPRRKIGVALGFFWGFSVAFAFLFGLFRG